MSCYPFKHFFLLGNFLMHAYKTFYKLLANILVNIIQVFYKSVLKKLGKIVRRGKLLY